MIPNPRQLNPATRYKTVKASQERILGWMARAGFLSEEELDAAKKRELRLRVGPT